LNHSKLIEPFEVHYKSILIKAGISKYRKAVKDVINELWFLIESLYKINYKDQFVYKGEVKHFRKLISRKKEKKQVGETYNITLKMFKEGKIAKEIAEERGMAKSTIEGHLGRLIKQNKIELFDVMEKEKAVKMLAYVEGNPMKTSTEVLNEIGFETTYTEIRWVFNHIALKKDVTK